MSNLMNVLKETVLDHLKERAKRREEKRLEREQKIADTVLLLREELPVLLKKALENGESRIHLRHEYAREACQVEGVPTHVKAGVAPGDPPEITINVGDIVSATREDEANAFHEAADQAPALD